MGEGLFKQIGNFYMKRYQEMAVPVSYTHLYQLYESERRRKRTMLYHSGRRRPKPDPGIPGRQRENDG